MIDSAVRIPVPPTVSVIVPVYKAEKYLRQCVDSILSQTFTDIELLLINDGSPDNSDKICDEYAALDPRVRVFHKPNGGVSSARNLGLANARGEWVSFVDSDDRIESTMLERLLKKADADNSDIVFCDFNFVFPDKTKKVQCTYNWEKKGLDGLAEFISTSWTILCGSIQKRALYTGHNLTSPVGITYCEDFHLITRLCFYAHNISKVKEPLYDYWQNPDSLMHNFSSTTWEHEQWAYYDTIAFFKEHNVYNRLEECMCFRALKVTQECILHKENFNQFISYVPEKKRHILRCPFLNKKQKIMAWCLTHNLKFITILIIILRNRYNNR